MGFWLKAVLSLILLAASAWLLLALPIYKQRCGEGWVYRWALGLYVCTNNDEASPDFQCHTKVGGLGDRFALRQLTEAECQRRLLETDWDKRFQSMLPRSWRY